MVAPKVTPPADVAALQAEVERLTKALAQASTTNEEAVRRAMMIAQDNEEVPTGKFVEVTRTLKGVEVTEQVPTFQYKIDMPPVGGVDIKLNGESYQHGLVYTFDLYTLRGIKEIVYRLRAHEASLHDNNENAYRRQQQATFSGKTGARIH